MKYLYGASVQGIQPFIFQTNKLREIVGASELVEQVCTEMFDKFGSRTESIVRAAGKISHVFETKEDCEKAALEFPRMVMTQAPGITISQAVVNLSDDGSNYKDQSNKLEKQLIVQRSRPVRSMTLGLSAIRRSPSTGLPAVDSGEDGLLDEASKLKLEASNTQKLMKKLTGLDDIDNDQIPYKIEKIASSSNWIAIVHADGNGMGRMVQEVCTNQDHARKFSQTIDKITTTSAREAYVAVVAPHVSGDETIPIRPVLLSGDDLAIICRADLAVLFAKVFLEKFEENSKQMLKACEDLQQYDVIHKGLTACAGIAFVKATYPFHYAVELAESLEQRAKKKAKIIDADLAPSCLMFHKVQDSFVEDFDEIAKRELQPQGKLSFEAGPYYVGEWATQFGDQCACTAEKLLDYVGKLKVEEGTAVRSHLRQWLPLLFEDVGAANQHMKRLRCINTKARVLIDEVFEKLSDTDDKTIPFHDILALISIE